MDHTMKNILFLFAALLTLTSSAVIKAEEGVYGQFFGGVNWLENVKRDHVNHDHNTGYLVGGAVGYEWCNNLRGEVEVAYRHNKLRRANYRFEGFSASTKSHHSLRTWSVLANAYYDIPLECSWLKPYIGAGIGYGNNKITHHRFDITCVDGQPTGFRRHHRDQSGFAWQFIAGLAYPVTCEIDLDIEYRYFQSHKHVRSNDLVFGAKYAF
jgi:opacity protein-like surface antigen